MQFSNNRELDASYIFANQFTSLGDFLYKLGENESFTLNVKDTKIQKYCMNNLLCSQMWGLTNREGLAGMTTREVLGRVSNFKNLEMELK